MKVLITSIIAVLILCSCETTPKNPEAWMEQEIMACLPTAIAFRQALQRSGVWSEVYTYNYNDENHKLRGHAMVAYLYPPGQNKLWTYDNWGSYRTYAYTNDLIGIAQKGQDARVPYVKTFNAQWIK